MTEGTVDSPSTTSHHDNNLEPHKKLEILSVTLHPGMAPNSPHNPIPVAEIAHLAGELFGTPDNPIQPAPKNLAHPRVDTSITTLKPAADEDDIVDDCKPAAIDPSLVIMQDRASLVPLATELPDSKSAANTNSDMDTEENEEPPPTSAEDPLKLLHDRIERSKEYLRRLEEAINVAKGNLATVPTSQNPYLTAAKSMPKDPPRTTSTIVEPTQPAANILPHNPDPSPFSRLVTTRPVYPAIPDPSPKRTFYSRYTWKIDIPSNAESPQKGFLQAVLEIWTVLKEADDKLILYPWRMRDHGQHKALHNPAKLPTSKEGITRYFQDAYF
jgi:hypothetical protein